MKSTCQHHIFRSMEKRDGETVAQFATRLRQVVRDCDHGDQAENQIGDQVSSVAIHKIWGENNLKKDKTSLWSSCIWQLWPWECSIAVERTAGERYGVYLVRSKQRGKDTVCRFKTHPQSTAHDAHFERKCYVEFKEYPVIFPLWYFPIFKPEVQYDLSLPLRFNSRRESVLLLLQR